MAIATTATARTAISHFLVTRISPLLPRNEFRCRNPITGLTQSQTSGDLSRQDWTQTCVRLGHELVRPSFSIPFGKPAELHFIHRTYRVHWHHGDGRWHGGLTFHPSIDAAFHLRVKPRRI